MDYLEKAPLGKTVEYEDCYQPDLLFALPRDKARAELGPNLPPFYGVDIWNAYELSWLDPMGKPRVAMASFWVPADSPRLIESKSLKLYLNSFNQTRFGEGEVKATLVKDLSEAAGAEVGVKMEPPCWGEWEGFCLDELVVSCEAYEPNLEFLQVGEKLVEETLISHVLKSNCLITGQPDWASVQIRYRGKQIVREGLLQYLVSFRGHRGFHEQCVEKMFTDIWKKCRPQELSVYARYTRRGGLDINPYRASSREWPENMRLLRQ